MPDSELRLRVAAAADALLIAHHRKLLFLEIRQVPEAAGDFLTPIFVPYLQKALASGSYHGWLLEKPDGAVVAGAGVLIRELMPRLEVMAAKADGISRAVVVQGHEALVVNVWVEPDHRRRGLARRLMQAILAWCRERNIDRAVLHPSAAGKPLYDSMGFVPTGELVLRTQGPSVPPSQD